VRKWEQNCLELLVVKTLSSIQVADFIELQVMSNQPKCIFSLLSLHKMLFMNPSRVIKLDILLNSKAKIEFSGIVCLSYVEGDGIIYDLCISFRAFILKMAMNIENLLHKALLDALSDWA